MTNNNSAGSQTVDRALEILKHIVLADRPVLLDEISTKAGVGQSVAYRIVRSLESAGYVGRDARQGGYIVAATFVSMSVHTMSRLGIGRALRPAMESIVDRYGETVSLHTRNGMQRVCIEVADGVHAVRRVIHPGETLPLYAGETGRALCGYLSEDDLARVLALAAQADVDVESFQRDLRQVRTSGSMIGIGVRTPGVGSISVPVRGGHGVVAAVTVSGPETRWSEKAMRAAAPEIIASVREQEEQLGFVAK